MSEHVGNATPDEVKSAAKTPSSSELDVGEEPLAPPATSFVMAGWDVEEVVLGGLIMNRMPSRVKVVGVVMARTVPLASGTTVVVPDVPLLRL